MGLKEEILIVEDDPTIRTLLELALKGAGYANILSVDRGDTGFQTICREKPALVLLDVMLPGLDGYAIASRVRALPELAATRIIMLTARTESEDIVRGLEAGADDYVTKPFDRLVLLARVKAVLRRTLATQESVGFDGLELNAFARRALLDGKPLDLTGAEFDLLTRLVAHRGRVFTRAADERSVDVHVAKLRQKLGSWAQHIETVRGIGYRVG